MAFKTRTESEELLLYRSLNLRKDLEEKEKHYYSSLEKGYEGEVKFDGLTETLASDWLVINDLRLEKNHSVFQNDTVLLSNEKTILCEVKNYEGDYVIKDDRWYTLSNVEVRNPLHQLERNESLLRRVFRKFGITTPIEPYLIFVNPEFYLYEAPLNLPIIFPTQLNRFISKLGNCSMNKKGFPINLAQQLVSMHLEKSPYMRFPEYHYDGLKKGITCAACFSFRVEMTGSQLVCKTCGHWEGLSASIKRGVKEFSFLFPDQKFTTGKAVDWFRITDSRFTMRRLLSQNLNQIGQGRYSYYVNY